MIYAILQMLLLITGHILIKYGFEFLNPFHVLIMMYIGAIGILTCYIVIKPNAFQKIRLLKKCWKPVTLFLFLCLINGTSFYAGLYYIGLSGVAILGRLSAVLMLISGMLFFAERLDKPQIVLTVVVIAASVLFSFSGEELKLNFIGTIMCLIASSSWAAINIVMKKFSNDINGIGLVLIRTPFLATCFGIAFIIALNMGWQNPIDWNISASDWLIFIGAGLCLSILPYVLFPIALRHTNLSVMSLINSIQPIIGFTAGILLFAEPLDNLKLTAAGITIMAGMIYSGHTYLKNNPPRIPMR